MGEVNGDIIFVIKWNVPDAVFLAVKIGQFEEVAKKIK